MRLVFVLNMSSSLNKDIIIIIIIIITQNLAFVGQAVSEKKIFEIVDDGRTDAGLIGIL